MYMKFKIKKYALLVYCLIVLSLFLDGFVFAYVINKTPNGNVIDWTYKPNPMGENYMVMENCLDCTGVATAIQKAAATWNSAGAKFKFTFGGTTTGVAAPNFDGINCIRWSSTGFGDPSTLATTTTWFYKTTGDILECDCVFNENYTWSTAALTPPGQFDVETVMLHEFGHFLSLDHSTPPAVMQPSVPSGTQRRTLTMDDINGIKAIYGARGFPAGPAIYELLLE
jgi:hypothetical protein